MIEKIEAIKIKAIKNVGQFDDISPQIDIRQFSLIYGENGRGKTTLVAILRSLATGEAEFIDERRRLGRNADAPHVELQCADEEFIFTSGAWNRTLPQIAIFDDVFISNNVCWGKELQTQHGQNLHTLILGEDGATVDAEHQAHVDRIEAHNTKLKDLRDNISPISGELYKVDEFCSLKPDKDIDAKIRIAEQTLEAAKAATKIKEQPIFQKLSLPSFDVPLIEKSLGYTLADLSASTEKKVIACIEKLGEGSEEWLASGVAFIAPASEGRQGEVCPFCFRDFFEQDIFTRYRSYFSEEYSGLKSEIHKIEEAITSEHGDKPRADFELDILKAKSNRTFWNDYIELPNIDLDPKAVLIQWHEAQNVALELLRAKHSSPLEPMTLNQEALQTFDEFHAHVGTIAALSDQLMSLNSNIDICKKETANHKIEDLQVELEKLKLQRRRFTDPIATVCNEYCAELNSKDKTAQLRDSTRKKLDEYRKLSFAKHEKSINFYLKQLNSSFLVRKVSHVNQRTGPSASYILVINDQDVRPKAAEGASFSNTLSAGDRNTLALSFFFASLDHNPDREKKIVIIDDPMSSLDDHRTRKTTQKILSLTSEVKQVIVLSHSQSFLYNLWKQYRKVKNKKPKATLRIDRGGKGSEIVSCDIEKDTLPEHDKRHALVSEYISHGAPRMKQEVGAALRPILEAFVRVAFPVHFPRGSMLMDFVKLCRKRLSAGDVILPKKDIDNLDDLRAYANQFHHETDAEINDTELAKYAKSTLLFISRR